MREGRWRRLHRPSNTLSHEARRRGKKKAAGLWVLLALVGAVAWADGPAPGWPAFLPPRDGFPADVAAAVERTWIDRTLSRTVRGPSVRAPFDLYSALIDAPDVTAAAARYRSFSKDEVRLVGDDLYEADDHDGSRGFYRVLARERDRRVMFSWGENSGSLLGTIRGDALTVLTLAPEDGRIGQALTAHVRIDNSFVAAVARVAEWATTQPGEFCGWLSRSGLPDARRAPIEGRVPGCPGSGGL